MSPLTISVLSGDEPSVIEITDPQVLAAVDQFQSPAGGVEACLRIGAVAMIAASTGVDLRAVREEMDRAVTATQAEFARVQEYAHALVSEDGPLQKGVDEAVDALLKDMRALLSQQVDADQPGTLLAKMSAAVKGLETALTAHRDRTREDLEQYQSKQLEALSRATREMRELDPNSAIGGAFTRLESMVRELQGSFAARQSASEERLRSAAKGCDFEQFVVETVAIVCGVHGDLAEHTGSQGGDAVARSRASKRGDITCHVRGVPAVVIEAMSRSVNSAKSMLVELDEACANRGAKAAIAVVANADKLMCGQPLQVLGENRWAVVLDPDQPNLLPLQLAYVFARSAATRAAATEFDFGLVRGEVESLNKALVMLAQVRTHQGTIQGAADKTLASLAAFEREAASIVSRILGYFASGGSEAA